MNGLACPDCGATVAASMRFCGACGRPLRDGSPRAATPDVGQRRYITVMFCDLVGSTALAESLDPEDFRDVLRSYQDAVARAIEPFGGYTAKYLGDGVLVYFGYPRAHEDDAQRAVHAGLAIVDHVAALNERLRDWLGIALHARIGVHTGLVVAGEMGAGDTVEPRAVVGEVPHIAARLESISEPDTIVISDATWELIAGYFETEPAGPQQLRGVSRPVGVHRVVAATGVLDRLDLAAPTPLTPIVGRDRELAVLGAAWRRVVEGEGVVVHVRGEPGIGKSRLVRRLLEQLGEEVRMVEVWQCSPHHRSSALHPVIRFLEGRASLARADPPENQLRGLDDIVRAAGLEPARAVPVLADLLSVPLDEQGAGAALEPLDARAATLRLLESLLVGDTTHHPMLLVVEDLHWADPSTLELLGRIVTSLPTHRVLCILTFRREFEPPWTDHDLVTQIELGRLSTEDVRAMVAATRPAALDATVLERVAADAEGVPLFVEEMVKVLDRAFTVPPTLRGLFTERLDRLPELRDVIDMAAVLGREFSLELLEALGPFGAADADAAVARLVAEDVVRPVAGPGRRYEFGHALLQETAYELILRRRRQELHACVADVFTRRFTADAEHEPEVAAYHWSRSSKPSEAVSWWRAAGSRALERAAFREAADHFRHGLDALDASQPRPHDDPTRAEFLTLLAASLQAGRGYAAPNVGDAYDRARSEWERLGRSDRLVSVIRGQWMLHLLRAEYPRARDLAHEMLALGTRSDEAVHLAEGHLYLGMVHMFQADFQLARDHLEEAAARYERPARQDQVYEAQGDTEVGALAYLALVLWNLGLDDESRRRSDLSLDVAERLGGPVTRAQAWGMRSLLHLARVEPVDAHRWAERTHAHSADRDIAYWRILSSLIEGWLRGRGGALDAGITQVRESIDAYLDSGSRLGLPLFSILLSDLWLAAGKAQRALEALRVGEEHIEATGERFSESELFQAKGKLLMASRSPDPHAATAAFGRALTAARQQGAKLLELRAATRLAVHERRMGETDTCQAGLASLCDWFGATSTLPDVARARRLVAGKAPNP
jgi:class 3 adenylate cyclase/predicted ATPase